MKKIWRGTFLTVLLMLLFLSPSEPVRGETATATDAPGEDHVIDLDSMDLPDEPDGGVPVSADSLTPEQKAQIKAWLSAHGYAPTRAGAAAAYQDYLNGKFDNDPEVQAALGRNSADTVAEETFIMDSATAWERAEDRRAEIKTEAETETESEVLTEEEATEEAASGEEEGKKERKILREKRRSHRILVMVIALGSLILVGGLVFLEMRIFGRKGEDPEEASEEKSEKTDKKEDLEEKENMRRTGR